MDGWLAGWLAGWMDGWMDEERPAGLCERKPALPPPGSLRYTSATRQLEFKAPERPPHTGSHEQGRRQDSYRSLNKYKRKTPVVPHHSPIPPCTLGPGWVSKMCKLSLHGKSLPAAG